MTSKSFGVKNLDVSGVGTFTTGLDLDGYLKDASDQGGSNGQILTSTGAGVSWSDISAISSNTGATGISFTDLNDTPSALGSAGQLVAVNSNADELEFISGALPTNVTIPYDQVTDPPGGLVEETIIIVPNTNTTSEITKIDTIFATDGAILEKMFEVSPDASNQVSLDLHKGNVFYVLLNNTTNTHTITFNTIPQLNGFAYSFTLILKNNSSFVPNTLVFPTTVDWQNNVQPGSNRTKSTGKADIYVFTTIDNGSNWYGTIASFNYG